MESPAPPLQSPRHPQRGISFRNIFYLVYTDYLSNIHFRMIIKYMYIMTFVIFCFLHFFYAPLHKLDRFFDESDYIA